MSEFMPFAPTEAKDAAKEERRYFGVKGAQEKALGEQETELAIKKEEPLGLHYPRVVFDAAKHKTKFTGETDAEREKRWAKDAAEAIAVAEANNTAQKDAWYNSISRPPVGTETAEIPADAEALELAKKAKLRADALYDKMFEADLLKIYRETLRDLTSLQNSISTRAKNSFNQAELTQLKQSRYDTYVIFKNVARALEKRGITLDEQQELDILKTLNRDEEKKEIRKRISKEIMATKEREGYGFAMADRQKREAEARAD